MKYNYPEGTVRISPISAVPDLLKSNDIDLSVVLQSAGLGSEVFEDPDNLISATSRAQLLHVCKEKTGQPEFGLLVGKQAGLASFGLVGYLAMHAQNVGEALNSMVNYLHLHGQGAVGLFEIKSNTAFMGYQIYQQLGEGQDLVEDAAIAALYNILRELCGSEWGPSEVWFTHRRPEDIGPYRQLFRTPLRFDMHKAGLFFSARWLKRTVRAADPELHRLLQKQIDELEARYNEDFPEQVRRILHHALLTRRVDAEKVAALFSIHSRTLHRRLKAHGTSFRELADESRFNIACHMLQSSDASMMQIAGMLDYADARVFSRAFKRWSGVSPSSWRKENTVKAGATKSLD